MSDPRGRRLRAQGGAGHFSGRLSEQDQAALQEMLGQLPAKSPPIGEQANSPDRAPSPIPSPATPTVALPDLSVQSDQQQRAMSVSPPSGAQPGVFGTLDAPLTETDSGYIQLISRAKSGAISYQEAEALLTFLTISPVYDATIYLNQAEERLVQTYRDDYPRVTLSKFHLDFGFKGAKIPLKMTCADIVTLTSLSKRPIRFTIAPTAPSSSYALEFEPSTGVVRKGEAISISVRLLARTTFKLRDLVFITLSYEDGAASLQSRQVLILNSESAETQFGRPIQEVAMTDDGGLRIPSVLYTMKRFLVAGGGLTSEGLFRLAADEAEVRHIRAQLDNNTFNGCSDVNALANLIKVWLRELPVPLLASLRRDVNVDSPDDCRAAYEALPQPNKDTMTWLLDLMIEVANNETTTRMNAKNLAIVIAPNLQRPESVTNASGAQDALASLYVSTKMGHFVFTLLKQRMNAIAAAASD